MKRSAMDFSCAAALLSPSSRAVAGSGISHQLDGVFFLMATQNPLEMEGTYPLPEAQLDRFLFKILVPFPAVAEMETIIDRTTAGGMPTASNLVTPERVLEMSAVSRKIQIADTVRLYAIELVMRTHPDQEIAPDAVRWYVRYGSRPGGAQGLILAAKINAVLDDRYQVATEDIQAVAVNVLRHRILLNFEGQAASRRHERFTVAPTGAKNAASKRPCRIGVAKNTL